MFTTTEIFPAFSFDESWDHGLLPDDDAIWLEFQQDTDLSKTFLHSVTANVHVESVVTDPVHIKHEPIEDDEDELFAVGNARRMTKEQLRKHKNRESAARSRQRSRSRLEQLERLVMDLETKHRQLQQTLTVMHYHRAQGATNNAGFPAQQDGSMM